MPTCNPTARGCGRCPRTEARDIRHLWTCPVASTVVTLAALAATGAPVAPGATLHHFDATVISKNSSARTFRANVQRRGVMRFKVTRSTRFERVAGFAGLDRNLEVEVIAKRSAGRWVAVTIERPGRGGGGRRGGNDD